MVGCAGCDPEVVQGWGVCCECEFLRDWVSSDDYSSGAAFECWVGGFAVWVPGTPGGDAAGLSAEGAAGSCDETTRGERRYARVVWVRFKKDGIM